MQVVATHLNVCTHHTHTYSTLLLGKIMHWFIFFNAASICRCCHCSYAFKQVQFGSWQGPKHSHWEHLHRCLDRIFHIPLNVGWLCNRFFDSGVYDSATSWLYAGSMHGYQIYSNFAKECCRIRMAGRFVRLSEVVHRGFYNMSFSYYLSFHSAYIPFEYFECTV